MNKNIIIGIVVVVLVGAGIFLLKPKSGNTPNNQSAQQQADDIVGKVEKEIEKKAGGSSIVVPENLQDCPSEWFQKQAGREKVVCDASQKAPYCSYYTVEKDGKISTKLLEFTSECAVCQNHKHKGEVFLDGSAGKYTHLGYLSGECTQGMYKKN
jgi:hypothetical protein